MRGWFAGGSRVVRGQGPLLQLRIAQPWFAGRARSYKFGSRHFGSRAGPAPTTSERATLVRGHGPLLQIEHKKGPHKEGLLLFLVAGASCQRYLALVTALDVAT